MKLVRRIGWSIPIALILGVAGCGPNDREAELEERGSAAPDLTSETTPPPVPPVTDDTTGIVDAAPTEP